MPYTALKRRSSTVLRAVIFTQDYYGSGFALDLGPPPAGADEQETPVVEEFRGLAFEGMADELENPSGKEKTERVRPQAVEEEAGKKQWQREQDGWDAQGVAEPVHGMLVTGGVL
jgi:hypothetical protein